MTRVRGGLRAIFSGVYPSAVVALRASAFERASFERERALVAENSCPRGPTRTHHRTSSSRAHERDRTQQQARIIRYRSNADDTAHYYQYELVEERRRRRRRARARGGRNTSLFLLVGT